MSLRPRKGADLFKQMAHSNFFIVLLVGKEVTWLKIRQNKRLLETCVQRMSSTQNFVYEHAHACRGQRLCRRCLPQSLHLTFQTRSLIEPGAQRSGRRANQQVPGILLSLYLGMSTRGVCSHTRLFTWVLGSSCLHGVFLLTWGRTLSPAASSTT